MNNTDEMKLGEQQRQLNKAKALGRGFSSGAEGLDVYASLSQDYWRGAAKRATDRADSLYIEYLAASSKLQIMKGLAILGWAAVILMALGV